MYEFSQFLSSTKNQWMQSRAINQTAPTDPSPSFAYDQAVNVIVSQTENEVMYLYFIQVDSIFL